MKKLAFVFAGQGSQYPQMGLDFLEDNLDLNTLSKKSRSYSWLSIKRGFNWFRLSFKSNKIYTTHDFIKFDLCL